jgi:hypothetical protein
MRSVSAVWKTAARWLTSERSATGAVPDYLEVPAEVMAHLRKICGALPDAYEEKSWSGFRWRVRKRTFVAVWTRQLEQGRSTRLQFRSPDPEYGFLIAAGPPFERAGWGDDVVNMHIDDDTDWNEVGELLIESYCVMAPKGLAALVPRDNSGR